MPIHQYSVLVGDPQPGKVSGPHGKPPHYLIPVLAGGSEYQIAINIESDIGDAQVLYNIQTDFQPPNVALVKALPPGMHPLAMHADPAIDFIRSRSGGQPILRQAKMQLLPRPAAQDSGNLNNAVVALLNKATADPNGLIYAFGSQYTDGTGIHDIHMNQGNPESGGHGSDNGIWQDGSIWFQLPGSGRWTAIFIAFQGQNWEMGEGGNPM